MRLQGTIPDMRSSLDERALVLGEIIELVEKKMVDWDHIDPARQALEELHENLHELLTIAQQSRLDVSR
jgi:c-di-GMP-related signal transduction protein